MIKLSVVICTHNPKRDFIQRVLDGLRLQVLSKEKWELVLIDNASAPPLASELSLDWHPNSRKIVETKLGLTHARLRGIKETSAPLLVFVDDDNVLASDYLNQVLSISERFAQIGAFGGQCLPDFVDGPPPEWTQCYWNSLGIWEFDEDFWSNRNDVQCVPCGAGLVVCRDVAEAYFADCNRDVRRQALDRSGQSLVSGGDYDLALCAIDLGLGIGKFRDLVLTHLMPSSRLEEQYLIRLWRAVHCSGKILNYIRYGQVSEASRTTTQRIRRLLRLVLGGSQDVHFRFGVAAEKGLRDADSVIESLGHGPNDS